MLLLSRLKFVMLVIGLVLFIYFMYKFFTRDKQFLSPVPIDNGIKVIQLKSS